jgi:hypothetical protein
VTVLLSNQKTPPEEAEIFKDYLFILALFSVRLPLFSYNSYRINVYRFGVF